MSLWVLVSSSWECMHWDNPFHIFWFHFRLKSFHTFLRHVWVSFNQELWLPVTYSLISSVQSLSHVKLFATPWTAAHQVSLSITNSWSLLKLMSIESVMPSNHLILCHPLSSCLQSFPASESFPMSQFFTSDGHSIGASASVLSMNIQDWFPLGLTGLISLQSRELSRVFSNTTVQKHQFFSAQLSLFTLFIQLSSSHIHTWQVEKS